MRSYLKEKACCVGKKVSIYIKETGGVCSCRREGIPHLAYFSACLCGILPVGGRLPICFCRAFPCGAEDAIVAACCRGPRRRRERRGAYAVRLWKTVFLSVGGAPIWPAFHRVFPFNGGKLCGNSGKPFKNPLQTPIYSRRKKTVVRSEENPQKQGSPCGREGKLVGIRWKSG